MLSDEAPEHFVTLFDRNFLAAGLCLYRSLERHARPFVLWVVCMDEVVEARLRELALPAMRLLPLAAVETAALKGVRSGRTAGEYCWTITPFTPGFVMEREPSARRVTYLDADLFFFSHPRPLLEEMEAARAHVLITPHAYSPEYDLSERSGVYCVQFVPFRNTPEARRVLAWWQERCIEWCYARLEDGKFGDQKYLDDWPQRFAGVVHVLHRPELALGPWNANRFPHPPGSAPVFFHFHGLRRAGARKLLLYAGYRLTPEASRPYDEYLPQFAAAVRECEARWGDASAAQAPGGFIERLRRLRLAAKGALRYAGY